MRMSSPFNGRKSRPQAPATQSGFQFQTARRLNKTAAWIGVGACSSLRAARVSACETRPSTQLSQARKLQSPCLKSRPTAGERCARRDRIEFLGWRHARKRFCVRGFTGTCKNRGRLTHGANLFDRSGQPDSGVSGGSVTAAYFALHGPDMLSDFRKRF